MLTILAGFLLLNFSVGAQTQTGAKSSNAITTQDRSIKNIPYSAEGKSETIQTLPDGNKISRSDRQRLFRDSQGRTRNEIEIDNGSSIRKSITIFDPIAGFIYGVNPVDKTVYRGAINSGSRNNIVAAPQTGYSTKFEQLGSKLIEGIESTGSRSVTTIAPGTVGNEKEIQTIYEHWSSPELRTIIWSKSVDPRSGERVFQLTNIKREEPDPSLFVIPADYKIVEQKGGLFTITNLFTIPKP